MKTRSIEPAALTLLLVILSARADARTSAPPAPSLALALVDVADSQPPFAAGAPASPHAGFAIAPPGDPRDGTRLESIRYGPRWRRRYHADEDRGGGRTTGFTQIHGGFFDPDGDVANAAVFGVRVGSNFDDRVQLGIGVDLSHRSDRQSAVVGSGTLPSGQPVERRVDLASASSNLLPVLAFLQVSPTGARAGGPFVGVAGGYEALFLSAKDFSTGEDFDATYDGWGWQFFGGFAFPMTSNSRLTIEGFTNTAELDRKVDDPSTGMTFREIVNADGAGMRFGLSWGF